MSMTLPPYAAFLGITLEPGAPDASPVLRMEFADALAGQELDVRAPDLRAAVGLPSIG